MLGTDLRNAKLVEPPGSVLRKFSAACTHLCTQYLFYKKRRGIFAENLKHYKMETLSVREYRNNLAASFTKADQGNPVLIRRKNNLYALVSVGKEDVVLTQELKTRIAEAEAACREGRCITCSTKDELVSFIESL
jgi:antitoxin (DNA-binding transcriptional repressor) of toxin-antitoxin stability system